jgi:hypothetical protein
MMTTVHAAASRIRRIGVSELPFMVRIKVPLALN